MERPALNRESDRQARVDEIAGTGPGLALAAGLGVVSGLATVVVLVGWLRLADISGTFQSTGSGALETVGWWIVFWLALSAGLLGALWLAFRAWHGVDAVGRRREEAREGQQAIAEAAAILDEARRAGISERDD